MEHWIVESVRCKYCGKLTFDTQDDAEYAGKRYSLPVYAYECRYGTGWHLSRMNK